MLHFIAFLKYNIFRRFRKSVQILTSGNLGVQKSLNTHAPSSNSHWSLLISTISSLEQDKYQTTERLVYLNFKTGGSGASYQR